MTKSQKASEKSKPEPSRFTPQMSKGHYKEVKVARQQMERLDRIKAGCIKDYGERHHTSDEMLAVIKKYKLTEKQWKRRMKQRDS